MSKCPCCGKGFNRDEMTPEEYGKHVVYERWTLLTPELQMKLGVDDPAVKSAGSHSKSTILRPSNMDPNLDPLHGRRWIQHRDFPARKPLH